MVSDEEHFDPSESILKDSLNTIKSEMDYFANTIIELKGKKVKIPLLGKEQEGGVLAFGLACFKLVSFGIMYLR